MSHPTPEQLSNQIKNANLVRLVTAYRTHGHKAADLDPLGLHIKAAPELNIEQYGFSKSSAELYDTDGSPKLTHLIIWSLLSFVVNEFS